MTGTVFFFNDTATTEIYTLSLPDALPICALNNAGTIRWSGGDLWTGQGATLNNRAEGQSSEHKERVWTVCRLRLAKELNNAGTVQKSGGSGPRGRGGAVDKCRAPASADRS